MKKRLLFATLALCAMNSWAQPTIVPYTWTTIAGQPQTYGWADSKPKSSSPGATAKFDYPTGVALDSKGNLYVADQGNDVIRKMTQSNGVWTVTTFAGKPDSEGFADNPVGTNALFNRPTGITVDSQDNIYVADGGNNAIREITPSGAVTTIAGDTATLVNGAPSSGANDGPALQAQFDFPTGVAVDKGGNVFIIDSYNNVVRELTKATGMVSTFAGSATATVGSNNGVGGAARFDFPYGISIDASGNLYVGDVDNNEIRKITPDGNVSSFAGSALTQDERFDLAEGWVPPNQDGSASEAGFYYPYAAVVDTLGNAYITDTYHSEIRKVSPQGAVITIGGQEPAYDEFASPPYPFAQWADGSGTRALFYSPLAIAVDAAGNIFVADNENSVIRMGTAPVVQCVAIEVTQVIQDWNNSIPLVQGKETYVRAHLQVPPEKVYEPVTVSGALLYGTGPGGPLPGSPLTSINDNAQVDVVYTNAARPLAREAFAHSLNFRLPPSWTTGAVTLQLDWPGGLQAKNVVSSNCSVQVSFTPVATPRINFYPVKWTDRTNLTHIPDATALASLPQRILACYPVAQVNATFKNPISAFYNRGLFPTNNNIRAVIDAVRNSESAQPYTISHGVLGVDPADATAFSGFCFDIPGSLSYSLLYGAKTYGRFRQTAAHELGHNLGLYHDVDKNLFGTHIEIGQAGENALGAANEDGPIDYTYPLFQPFHGYPKGAPTLGPMTSGDNSMIYGLDTLTLHDTATGNEPVVCPTNSSPGDENFYFDLMSYCVPPGFDQEDSWPSSVTYKSLIDRINATFSASATNLPHIVEPPNQVVTIGGRPPLPPRPQGGNGGGSVDYLVVRGDINFATGGAQLYPCLLLSTTNTPPEETPGTNFLLSALDSSGHVLESSQFAVEPNTYGDDDTNTDAGFVVFFARNPAIHKFVLSAGGVTLATITGGVSAPPISLTSLNGGEKLSNGPVNISWLGGAGAVLTYTVQYSADDGVNWQTLDADETNENVTVDASLLPASTEALVRVVASDGVNIATAQSASTFTVLPHAPVITINTPQPGEIFFGDQQLFLDATVNDMQDGFLDGANVQWSSDVSGPVGAGAVVNFDPMILSEGIHTMTITATDSEGQSSSAETQILILHYPPPQLQMQYTPGEFFLGDYYPPYMTLSWPSYYTNYVLQSSSNLTSGWAAVTNAFPETSGAQQQVSFNLSTVTTFFRLMLQL